MFSVEIRSRSCDAGETPWVDHLGNPIDRLVFSKKYYAEYVPGHYPIESLGSLYRNIDDFRQSPLQRLTDWEIRIPSVYSSDDGLFQTLDLFYFLECANEESGLEFDLTGCEAVLLDGGQPVFIGSVNSVQSGTGGIAISIGESIGSPEIKKSDFPLVFGSAAIDKWPVKIEGNEIIVSDRRLSRFDGFYVYLEKLDKYVKVDFDVWILFVHQRIRFDSFWMRASFSYSNAYNFALDRDVPPGSSFQVSDAFRKLDLTADAPVGYAVGNGSNRELLQAWSNSLSDDGTYSLGRETMAGQREHFAGEIINELPKVREKRIQFSLMYCPESLMALSATSTLTIGNPSFFLELSRFPHSEWEDKKSDASYFPRAIFTEPFSYSPFGFNFDINFPELGLPADASVFKITFYFRIRTTLSLIVPNSKFASSVKVFADVSIGDKKAFSFDPSAKSAMHKYNSEEFCMEKTVSMADISLSDLRQMRLHINIYSILSDVHLTGDFTLMAANMQFEAFTPTGNLKLYAGGVFAGSADSNSNSGESIIPSVNGLLAAASADGYSASAAGSLANVKYGSIASGEAVSLRDKLRELAAESATLVKSAPCGKELLAKSVSRQFEHEAVLIPLDAIASENGMFYFRMESSYRNELLNEILISWGKSRETGKYEHSLAVDAVGFAKDGARAQAITGILGDGGRWDSVFEQLKKNRDSNVGTSKSIDCEWIMNWEGAELMAYNYLCWNCAPLRKAQIKCISSVLKALSKPVDIGDFVYLDLPGYPLKLSQTAWVVTGRHDDLDKMASALELLEAWNMPVVPPGRFLLLESGGNILTNEEQKIKLESFYE